MSNIFFISDTHFFHNNIIKYCGRPENHEELIIERWNNTVGKDDIVFHLGDLAFKLSERENDIKEIISKLNGHKILALGNHDHRKKDWYYSIGFEEVEDIFFLEDFFINHYPLVWNDHSREKEIALIKERKALFAENGCSKVIHGHIHNANVPTPENHFNVSVEVVDYTPVSFEEIKSILR
jgi:calcineurin-like phosphoesterase family protein